MWANLFTSSLWNIYKIYSAAFQICRHTHHTSKIALPHNNPMSPQKTHTTRHTADTHADDIPKTHIVKNPYLLASRMSLYSTKNKWWPFIYKDNRIQIRLQPQVNFEGRTKWISGTFRHTYNIESRSPRLTVSAMACSQTFHNTHIWTPISI